MKFKCLNCKESCCSRKTVALNPDDVKRILKIVPNVLDFVIFRNDLPEGKTVKGNKVSGVLTLKQNDGDCIFLKDNKCSIHKYRPLACRMYPYNPIFIERKDGYNLKMTTDILCAGIGKGEEFNIMPTALQWRKERLVYDKFVDKWNKRKDRDLVKFMRLILNGTYNSN